MEIYFGLFLLLLIYTFVEIKAKKEIGFAHKIMIVLILVVLSGFRYEVGNDYENYESIFYLPENYVAIEKGFKKLIELIKLVGGNVQLLFLVCSILSIVPIAVIIQKINPRYFVTSLSTYVFSYIYFEGMNTVRQAVAMSLCLVAVYLYIKNQKLLVFSLLILLATLFHTSSLFIGVLFISIYKLTNSKLRPVFFTVLLVASFIAGYFIGNFVGVITDIVGGTVYDRYLDRVQQRGVSSGLFHIVLNIYALVLMLFVKDKDRYYNLFELTSIKMFLLSVIVYNFFFNFYIGLRFYWFFYLYAIFVLPLILESFQKKSRFLVFLGIVMVFILYTLLSLDTPTYNSYSFNFSLTKPM